MLASIGHAQESTSPAAQAASNDDDPLTLAVSPATPHHDAFTRDSWTLQLDGSYVSEQGGSNDIHGEQINAGASYYLLDRVAVVGELSGYHFNADNASYNDAYGGGFDLLLRWHFLQIDRFTLYADAGAGAVQFDQRFPPEGTHFNFALRAGLGATYRLTDNLHLMGGSRFFHVSNADLEGSDHNPGLDSFEFYLGLMLAL